jgi:hypothetical protein
MEGNDPNFLQQPLKAKPAPLARYLYTATLITVILLEGHRSPHRTLDECVKKCTRFTPTDGTDWTKIEPELSSTFEVTKLDFERLSESPRFL